MRPTATEVLDYISDALLKEGFKLQPILWDYGAGRIRKISNGAFTIHFDENVIGFLQHNIRQKKHWTVLKPSWGLYHGALMDLIVNLGFRVLPREQRNIYEPPTILRYPGDLFGRSNRQVLSEETRYKILPGGRWDFHTKQDLKTIGGIARKYIEVRIIPFIKANQLPEAMLKTLAPFRAQGYQWHEADLRIPYVLPALLLMLERYDEILDCLDPALAVFGKDPIQLDHNKHYQDFARNVIIRMQECGYRIPKARLAKTERIFSDVRDFLPPNEAKR